MEWNNAVVYVVDDDPQMCDSLVLALRSAGLDVQAYSSAERFLAEFECRLKPACLLVDIRLPGCSGITLYRRLKAQGYELPVIFITGFPETETAVEAMREGAVDLLVKPFTTHRLLERIDEALGRAQAWAERIRMKGFFQEVIRGLNLREKQVLREVLAGKEAKRIAAQLGITAKSVLRYRAQLLEKFQVSNVVRLVQMAHQAGWNDVLEMLHWDDQAFPKNSAR
jgi:FixJ family two-component response regulator